MCFWGVMMFFEKRWLENLTFISNRGIVVMVELLIYIWRDTEMMKKEKILKKLMKLNVCTTVLYKLIHSGLLDKEIDKIKKIEIEEEEDSVSLGFLVRALKLDMEVKTRCGETHTYKKGNKTKFENSKGFWVKYTYTRGNNTRCETSTGYWETMKYDSNGNLIGKDDAFGGWETWEYDINGNAIKYNNSGGYEQFWKYDERGNKIWRGDSWNNWDTWEYDTKGNLTKYNTSNGYWKTYEYDTKGKLTHWKNSNGFWDTFKYDTKGNLVDIEMSEAPDINKYKILEKRT